MAYHLSTSAAQHSTGAAALRSSGGHPRVTPRVVPSQSSRQHHKRAVWVAVATPSSSSSSSSSGASQPAQPSPQEDGFEGLLPEEDYEVPGGYMEAMSSATKLGKAVKAACEELEHLGNLEAEVLSECDDLLKQLGMKGSLFGGGDGSDNPLLRLQQELQAQAELEEQHQQQQQQGEKQS